MNNPKLCLFNHVKQSVCEQFATTEHRKERLPVNFDPIALGVQGCKRDAARHFLPQITPMNYSRLCERLGLRTDELQSTE